MEGYGLHHQSDDRAINPEVMSSDEVQIGFEFPKPDRFKIPCVFWALGVVVAGCFHIGADLIPSMKTAKPNGWAWGIAIFGMPALGAVADRFVVRSAGRRERLTFPETQQVTQAVALRTAEHMMTVDVGTDEFNALYQHTAILIAALQNPVQETPRRRVLPMASPATVTPSQQAPAQQSVSTGEAEFDLNLGDLNLDGLFQEIGAQAEPQPIAFNLGGVTADDDPWRDNG
jgi:hypothetical protein